MIVTTSWDDGYKEDLRIAEVLTKHGLKGTFYVCPVKQHAQTMLNDSEIQTLAKHHEVGAHSLTHPRLTTCNPKQLKQELEGSRQWVEQCTGKPCSMFCYPKGDVNDEVAEAVKKAGFKGARTVEQLSWNTDNPYLMPTTLQVYPVPLRPRFTRWWHVLDPFGRVRVLRPGLHALGVPLSACRNWKTLAIATFEKSKQQGKSFFHLWGHSVELSRFGLWQDFEEVCAHIGNSNDCEHRTNSECLAV